MAEVRKGGELPHRAAGCRAVAEGAGSYEVPVGIACGEAAQEAPAIAGRPGEPPSRAFCLGSSSLRRGLYGPQTVERACVVAQDWQPEASPMLSSGEKPRQRKFTGGKISRYSRSSQPVRKQAP